MEAKVKSTVILAAKVAAQIIISGGEIERAEYAAQCICTSYGLENVSIFALNSVVIASCEYDSNAFCHAVRIRGNDISLFRLEEINDFSRRICAEKTLVTIALCEFELICAGRRIKPEKEIVGSMITAGVFALFFGGMVKDFFIACLLSAYMHFQKKYLKKLNTQPSLICAFLSLFTGLLTLFLKSIFLCSNHEAVMLGCLMPLFPGISLINSLRNFLSNDTISAVLQLTQAFITSLSIAAGFALSILLWNKL